MKKDQNGKQIKVGMRLQDRKGDVWLLQNLSGVCMLTQSDEYKITKTIVWEKVKMGEWEVLA